MKNQIKSTLDSIILTENSNKDMGLEHMELTDYITIDKNKNAERYNNFIMFIHYLKLLGIETNIEKLYQLVLTIENKLGINVKIWDYASTTGLYVLCEMYKTNDLIFT